MGTVPVVLCPDDIDRYFFKSFFTLILIPLCNLIKSYAPLHSIIKLPHLESVKPTANLLKQLIANNQYISYLDWKRHDLPDPFLAYADISLVHSSCSLSIHAGTDILLHEAAEEEFPHICKDTKDETWIVFKVRERGTFQFRNIVLSSHAFGIAELYAAIYQAFKGYNPIWSRKRTRGGAPLWYIEKLKSGDTDGSEFAYGDQEPSWFTSDYLGRKVPLRIYKLYTLPSTQERALYGDGQVGTNERLSAVLEGGKWWLECVFL